LFSSFNQKYASKISIIPMPSPADTGYYLSKEELEIEGKGCSLIWITKIGEIILLIY
jgi:hypothetical protein